MTDGHDPVSPTFSASEFMRLTGVVLHKRVSARSTTPVQAHKPWRINPTVLDRASNTLETNLSLSYPGPELKETVQPDGRNLIAAKVNQETTTHSGEAVWTAIGADLAIATIKFAAFAFTRSSGMLSEAVHSLVDAGNGSLLVFGLRQGKRAPDESHPFGYGKEVYFWTLLVALFIFIIGGGASIFQGITRLRHPEPIEHVFWNYLTLALAACFEGYSLWIACRAFQRAEGVSASWKTIHASKDPSTFTVIFEDTAALAGLLTAFICTVVAHTLGWNLADPIASIVIGALLVSVALLLIIESKALLVGEGADLATLQALRRIAEEEPGVLQAGYPLTMYFGPSNVLLTMNLRFDERMGRDAIERAVDGVEARVRNQFPEVQHIYLEAEFLQAAGKDFNYQRIPDPAFAEPKVISDDLQP